MQGHSRIRPDIPGYRMLRQLGHGGMSEIWLAEQVALSRPVAVKLMMPGDEAEARVARFRQEAAMIARFDHPNVVGIIEFGETADGRLYYTMPYVPNGTLAAAGLRGDSQRLREVLGQLLEALAYVHEHGIVHRDVKPDNVLFDGFGRARLADFGVSRLMSTDSRHTIDGQTFGSSLYMSPEQARGELPDGRGDLYSLGVIAYELLTGQPPFQGRDHLSIVIAHLQSPVPRLPPDLHRWQRWLDTAMAKSADRRFRDAGTMLAGLQRLPPPGREAGVLRRWLTGPVTTAAAMLLIGILAGVLWVVRDPAMDADERVALVAVQPPQSSGQGPAGVAAGDGSAASEPFDAEPMDPLPPAAEAAVDFDDGVAAVAVPERPLADAVPVEATPPAAPSSPPASEVAESGTPAATARPAPAPSRIVPAATASAPPRSGTPAPNPPAVPTVAGFNTTPSIPLMALSGARAERLARIDAMLEQGRQVIEADKANTRRRLGTINDRAERNREQQALAQRERNYDAWRRQLRDLRRTARQGD